MFKADAQLTSWTQHANHNDSLGWIIVAQWHQQSGHHGAQEDEDEDGVAVGQEAHLLTPVSGAGERLGDPIVYCGGTQDQPILFNPPGKKETQMISNDDIIFIIIW